MLDTVEFHKKRKKLFNLSEDITDLPELQQILFDLEYVCANDRSRELAEIIQKLIIKTQNITTNQDKFKLHLLLFQQIYFYVEYSETANKTIEKLDELNKVKSTVEQEAFINVSKSLMNQFHSNIDLAIKFANKAFDIIKPHKDQFTDSYFRILYVYTLFNWTYNIKFPDAIQNIEACIQYWHGNYNTQPMILAIFQLLRIYSFQGNDKRIEKITNWVFEEEKIQFKLINTHYVLLYMFTGQIYTIRMKTKEAIEKLTEAYKKLSDSNLKFDMMYEYTELIRLLSRCYAYVGDFEQSYKLIMELLSYMEIDYVKRNYFEYGYKRLQFNSYYTLLFIFAQLDLSISEIHDSNLQKIHQYVKSLQENTNLSKELLFDTSMDEKQMRNILKKESKNPLELYVSLYQHLSSIEVSSATEKTIDSIKVIRDFTHNPLYADIILGKIYLSIGKYKEFENTVKKIENTEFNSEILILKLWTELLVLLKKYLKNANDNLILESFSSLEKLCLENNYRKLADEVRLYRALITSTRTVQGFSERFKQTAFLDIYNTQAKKLVLDSLQNETLS